MWCQEDGSGGARAGGGSGRRHIPAAHKGGDHDGSWARLQTILSVVFHMSQILQWYFLKARFF
jgi:hypothetical protein